MLVLILIGNFLPKIQPNHAAGIRLPWTLANPKIGVRLIGLLAGLVFYAD